MISNEEKEVVHPNFSSPMIAGKVSNEAQFKGKRKKSTLYIGLLFP